MLSREVSQPHLKHCVPEAVSLAGLAAMRQQAMFSCYLCVLFFRYRWAKRDGHVRQDHLQDQQTLLWTEPGFCRPSRFSFWLKKAQIVFNSAWHLRCFSVVVIVFAFLLSIGRDHYEGDIGCVWWGHYH